jgi:hypothetical protein
MQDGTSYRKEKKLECNLFLLAQDSPFLGQQKYFIVTTNQKAKTQSHFLSLSFGFLM